MAFLCPPVAIALNRGGRRSDKSATAQKRRDASFESLTTRLRQHGHAGPEQENEKRKSTNVCPYCKPSRTDRRARTIEDFLPQYRCACTDDCARWRDHRR